MVGLGVALWAPSGLAPVPLVLAGFVSVLAGTSEGLADEQDRVHFRLAPGSMAVRTLAVAAVPFVRGLLATLVAVLPVVA